MTEPIPIEDLTFGIELEVIIPRARHNTGRDGLAAAMVAEGLAAEHEQYNHRTRPHWKITTDSSIGYDNAEVVSPILKGDDGFDQVRKCCRALEAYGCRVNRTTGFHVHVGVRDRFAQQIGFFKELMKTYAKYEPIIDGLVASSRRAENNQFCRPVRFTERMVRATSIDGLIGECGSRFVKLNLQAYQVHGTVEFRQHQGTTNAQKIENWVKLCLRMVAHAAKNTEVAGRGEFRPPMRPVMPAAPVFRDEIDWDHATRVIGAEIPRFIQSERYLLRGLVITYVIGRTPRREGTAGRENHDRHNAAAAADAADGRPQDLWTYHRNGGRRTHLAWDVDHGYVRVVRRWAAPPMAPGSTESGERARIAREHRERVAQLEREHERAVDEARRAWEVMNGSSVPVTRPATDSAPATLEGLLELIAASEPERAYFSERQLELNE
jgi:hypothetical protein